MDDSPSDKDAKTESLPSTVKAETSPPSLTIPPIAADRPGGTAAATGNAQGLSSLKPLGVNTNLFSEKLSNESARLDRLESAVQSLRNDFDGMAPAITRLVAVEGDIQDLIVQLETMMAQEAAAPPPVVEEPPVPLAPPDTTMPAPAPVAAAPPQNASAPVTPPAAPAPAPAQAPAQVSAPKTQINVPGADGVYAIRIGEHPGKTRIVLDLKGKPDFTHDLDNAEKILILELSSLAWNAPAQGTFSSSPLISSYRVDPLESGSGSRLILQLKSAAAILYKSTLEGTGSERKIVIDLGKDTSTATTQ